MRGEDWETRPKPVVAHEIGSDISAVSVDELRERVALLEREIERLRQEEVRKLASRDAAGAFFRT